MDGREEAEDSNLWVSVDAEEDWSGRTTLDCRATGGTTWPWRTTDGTCGGGMTGITDASGLGVTWSFDAGLTGADCN